MSRKAVQTSAAPTRRCAIYTRKSTSVGLEQNFNSLHAQREACVAYISRQAGWTLVPEQYDDGGFTGANTDRPAFQRLMADVEAKRVDVIVVYKVDRLSRSLLDFVKVMERLNAADASFVSVTQNFSTADAMGRLTLNVLMSFAEFEREMIAERTRDKIAASRRKGKWTGGPVPFGYVLKDKRLAIKDTEAAIVREAFRLHVQHGQMVLVARELTARGLLPRRSSTSKPNKSHFWTKDSIARVLRNPLYAGIITCGNEQFQGEHEALIDDQTWQTSQRVLSDRSQSRTNHGVNLDYVLRGLVRCGRCGSAMCPGSTRKGGKVHRYYRCSTRDKHGREHCAAAPLAAGVIEGYVVERVSEIVAHGDSVLETYGELKRTLEQRRELLKLQQHGLAERVGEVSARAGKLADEWVNANGEVKDILGQRLASASAELKDCESALADVKAQLTALETRKFDIEWVTRALSNFHEVWSMMSTANQGRLMRALIDNIVIHDETGKVDIHLAQLDSDDESYALNQTAAAQ
jgi:DNA invertase Pin-like site-specific DNA recombinase